MAGVGGGRAGMFLYISGDQIEGPMEGSHKNQSVCVGVFLYINGDQAEGPHKTKVMNI